MCRIPLYVRIGIERLVRLEGTEHYAAGKRRGKGILIVAGHFGSFELGLASLAQRFAPVSVVVKAFPEGVDRFVNGIRACAGAHVIPARGAVKSMLRALKNNEAVVVIIDQNSTQRKGVFVEFFGKSACTMLGLAVVAERTGACVIGVSAWREPDGSHVVRLHPEFPLVHQESRADTVRHMTQTYTRFIEQAIRAHPEQWLWPHKRYKTRPSGEVTGNR